MAEPEPAETGDEDAEATKIERRWRLSVETVIAIGGLLTAIGTFIGVVQHGSGLT